MRHFCKSHKIENNMRGVCEYVVDKVEAKIEQFLRASNSFYSTFSLSSLRNISLLLLLDGIITACCLSIVVEPLGGISLHNNTRSLMDLIDVNTFGCSLDLPLGLIFPSLFHNVHAIANYVCSLKTSPASG